MQEDLGQFMVNPSLGSNDFQPWGGPLAHSSLENRIGNASTASYGSGTNRGGTNGGFGHGSASYGGVINNDNSSHVNSSKIDPGDGLKRAANSDDTSTPKSLPVKVKKELVTHTAASNHASQSASAATSTTEESNLQPRDHRETSMVASLREMGFTSTQEILTALRAVSAAREEVAIVGFGGSQWSMQDQVESAMMWIVTQREETAEAEKLDQARISSEQADAAMDQSRRQDMEQELKHANLVTLLGSVEMDDSIEIRSRHFPCSVLLRNRSIRAVLKGIAAEANLGKEQVIRLLHLEKKARKWYGTVLPFSYFEYVLCSRFESWAEEKWSSTANTYQRLSNESDELEKAMYNLSEQEEGGVGYVPKLFLAAQRDASQKGKPTSAAADNKFKDEDVLMLENSPPLKSGDFGVSLSGNCNKSVEVIELE